MKGGWGWSPNFSDAAALTKTDVDSIEDSYTYHTMYIYPEDDPIIHVLKVMNT